MSNFPWFTFVTVTFYIVPYTPLSSINSHHLSHHLHADDTQIYISLSTPGANCSLRQISNCLDVIFHWTIESKLRLNADETGFLLLAHKDTVKI